DEGTESTCEAGDSDFADHRSEHWHLEFEFIEDAPSDFCPDDEQEYHDADSEDDRRDEDVIFHHIADAEDETCERRQFRTFQHAFEHRLELRDDFHHQQDQDTDADDHESHGIEHGRDDLAFDLLRFFHELSQTREDDFKHAAQLTGAD